MTTPERWLTARDVTRITGEGYETTRRKMESGEIPSVRQYQVVTRGKRVWVRVTTASQVRMYQERRFAATSRATPTRDDTPKARRTLREVAARH